MIMGWIPDGSFDIHHALLLCASSMLTAAVASFVLGKSIMYEKKN
jgi:solute carrier family 41